MKDLIAALLSGIKDESITFGNVIEFVDTYYWYHPTAFKNGDIYNEATQNQGSARVFAMGRFNDLSKHDTLILFAEHYRSVQAHPEGTDHQNIRQFMEHGWPGIVFEGEALQLKQD